MCYSSENRERKNSLCVKVKFTINVHSPKEVFRCGHYNTGYAFSLHLSLIHYAAHHDVTKTASI